MPGSPTTLSSGTRYWLVALPGAADTFDGWAFNNTGTTGLLLVLRNGSSISGGSSTLGAFDVLDTSVPKPMTGFLLGAGLVLLAAVRRAPAM